MSAVGSPKNAAMGSPDRNHRSPKLASPGGLAPGELPLGAAAPDEHTAIDIDRDEDQSTYTPSTIQTDTESLRSSIMRYRWEHGRRYHAFKDGEYWAPNDDAQQDAESLQHEMYRRIFGGKLFISPIAEPAQAILDLGCGNGAWCIDVADELPSAEVIGVDLSPIQPPFVPPNCRFEVDDFNQEWTYPENKFDLIFLRSIPGCIPDLATLLKRAQKHLRPGGWIEHVQTSGLCYSDDDTLKEDSAIVEWYSIFKKLGHLTGKSFMTAEEAPDAFRAAGYKVLERSIKLPIGTWPRDPVIKQWGAWNRIFLLQAIEGFSIRGLTTTLNWSFDKAQLYLMQLRKELTDPSIHSYMYLRVAYAQKPEA